MSRHRRALLGVERPARAVLVAASGVVSCLNGSADPIVRVDSSVASDADLGADASRYCASLSPQPLFCEDFDEGSYAQGFTAVNAMSGTVTLGTAEFVSPPAAAVATSDALADGGPREDTALYASFAVSTGPFNATLDVDLRVDRADDSGGAALAQIGLVDAAGSEYFVQFTVTASGAGALSGALAEVYVPVSGAEAYTGHPFTQGFPRSTWTHVTLSIAAPSAGGAGTATLAYDGTPVATTAIDVKVAGFAPVLGVGLPFVSTPSTGWTAAIDNVVLRATNP